ncbi:conserved hypothetical protein [Tenacibaculum maritimum]|uniref:hypothetical protein n=1 Tax=Tenacibaculum maritimum TaxID=107401 RepID=UPI0012E65E76|nr:hypothetical protein [Tenacibaculum maritimum]CAA0145318.1 conserved hypothetical protein [Tenacibaculum maritimum]CAA0170077.1 conserved hypothetical protein [Tenacibaculum maritimum]CAA0174397.1 conserved hypothetical protein [Tenacibaculum maritimum]CAA0176432.1 conserved hypothetical protein [Tenacibaculum maritimum]
MEDKMILKPIKTNWRNNFSELKISLEEREPLIISFQADFIDRKKKNNFNEDYDTIETIVKQIHLIFNIYAELKFYMVDFFEFNYNKFVIQSGDKSNVSFLNEKWIKEDIYLEPYFYEVLNSSVNFKSYDSSGKHNLKHYLIIGYDSYVEVVVPEKFKIEVLDIN